MYEIIIDDMHVGVIEGFVITSCQKCEMANPRDRMS